MSSTNSNKEQEEAQDQDDISIQAEQLQSGCDVTPYRETANTHHISVESSKGTCDSGVKSDIAQPSHLITNRSGSWEDDVSHNKGIEINHNGTAFTTSATDTNLGMTAPSIVTASSELSPFGLMSETLTGTSGSPSDPDLGTDFTSGDVIVSEAQLPESGKQQQRQATEKQLHEAIEKVQQLDRHLEKKIKAHLEAQSATADLQTLIRRELCQLNLGGGRRETREETENTMRFLSALIDSERSDMSETSSQVTPIFQTQVRFGGKLQLDGSTCLEGDPAQAELSASLGHMPVGADSAEIQGCAGGDSTHLYQQLPDNYFIKRNIQLAQELGGSLAMTEEERQRLDQLMQEEDEPDNPFSVDGDARQLLHSIDDQLSSMGASISYPPSLPPTSNVEVSEEKAMDNSGMTDIVSAENESDGEPDYLEVTRQDRATVARLDSLQRRLRELNQPLEVRPLDCSDVNSMIQDVVATFVSLPRHDLKSTDSITSHVHSSTSVLSCSIPTVPADSVSETSVPTGPSSPPMTVPGEDDSESGSQNSTDRSEEISHTASTDQPPSGGTSGLRPNKQTVPLSSEPTVAPLSEPPSEATVDLRSVLSGGRDAENRRQLAAETRPDSPQAWLVDVDQGPLRYQLVVPRLCRKVISELVQGALGRVSGEEEVQQSCGGSGDGNDLSLTSEDVSGVRPEEGDGETETV